jgi:chromosome partitioning protein
MTYTIGVTNQKGGVGKTTTAVNLAAGLALRGRFTLLVDVDPQGNATSGVGISREDVDQTVYEAILGLSPIEGCILPTKIDKLFVLPSDMRLIAAEKELLDEARRETRLLATLRAISAHYQYIIVDSPPSLGLLTLNVLRAVDRLIIPVQSEYYALEGLTTLVETVRRVQAGVNPRLEILGLLMTMVDGRTNLARQVVEEVVNHFGDKVFQTVVARSVRLSEAPSFGEPILTYDPKSPSAQVHVALTREVIARCERPKPHEAASSIITSHSEEQRAHSAREGEPKTQQDKPTILTGDRNEHETPPSAGSWA